MAARFTPMQGFNPFVVLTAFFVVLMLAGPRRPRLLRNIAYLLAPAYNELPIHFLVLTLLSVAPEYWGGMTMAASSWVWLGMAVLLVAGLLVIARRGLLARPALKRALDEAMGEGWRNSVEPSLVAKLDGGPNWAKILLAPFFTGRHSVERVPNISYGPAGRANELDLYRLKSHPTLAPVLIYFHSGGYRSGSKRLGSAELLRRLASHGWVTISANYRLRPEAGFFDHLTDAKRVIAWVRQRGEEFGADPSTVVLAGGSAGAHLAAIAAQTQNEPHFQQGFEDVDTSVTAVVGMYGWYGGYYGTGGADSPVGPLGQDASQAPPFLIAHGQLDTLASVEAADRLAGHLREGSKQPVAYAPLPGGHHGFDLFYSLRYEAVVDATEAFLDWVLAERSQLTRGVSITLGGAATARELQQVS